MKLNLLILTTLFSIATPVQNSENHGMQTPQFTGYFDGTEPFWNMEINGNQIILHCVNDIITDTLHISKKQAHTETWAFKGKHTFGVIRKSHGGCELDITEEENPTHEIYFNYADVTYMGCGTLRRK